MSDCKKKNIYKKSDGGKSSNERECDRPKNSECSNICLVRKVSSSKVFIPGPQAGSLWKSPEREVSELKAGKLTEQFNG